MSIFIIHLSSEVKLTVWRNVDGFIYFSLKVVYMNHHIFNFLLDIYMLTSRNFFSLSIQPYILIIFFYIQTKGLSFICHKSQQQRPTLKRWSTRKIGIYTCLRTLYKSLSIITRSWLKRVNGSRIINQALISPRSFNLYILDIVFYLFHYL